MFHIDHIGYAVKRTDRAINSLKSLGYKFESTIRDEDRKIDITFGRFEGYRIELVCPYENGSPIEGILSLTGSAPYHICYRSDSFEDDISNLSKMGGYKMVIPPAKAVAFGGMRVCFLYSLGCGLIEIVEDREKK